MRHWLAHRLGLNGGRIITAPTQDDDTFYVGFLCLGCGSVSGWTEVHFPRLTRSWDKKE